MTRCFTKAEARLDLLVQERMMALTPGLKPRNIVIKPNWVLHETDPAFPIEALVTDARLIQTVVESCLRLFPTAESIVVGDCPLQYANWPLLCQQSKLQPIIERLQKTSQGKVVFRDLRREVFEKREGSFLRAADAEHGDPAGYVEVELGQSSHLEPISHQAKLFAVNDYSASVTSSNHAPGAHRYLVSKTVLQSDLFINLPKWKSHQKSGITAALKNLVGINSDKAYLPHFRRGAPKWGGDEYQDEDRWLYWAQTTLREKLQKRSRLGFKLLKPGWELIKKARGIQTRLPDAQATPKRFYIAGGAWHGNDTIWRMIYDLNLIIQQADATGVLRNTPQRTYLAIVDGLISGEGNGPLQPLPRETDWLLFGQDPFEIDLLLAWFMGFDPDKIPVLANRARFAGTGWGRFSNAELQFELDGVPRNLANSPENFHFAPPPGWRGHIER